MGCWLVAGAGVGVGSGDIPCSLILVVRRAIANHCPSGVALVSPLACRRNRFLMADGGWRGGAIIRGPAPHKIMALVAATSIPLANTPR
jgi:hypothetical protein